MATLLKDTAQQLAQALAECGRLRRELSNTEALLHIACNERDTHIETLHMVRSELLQWRLDGACALVRASGCVSGRAAAQEPVRGDGLAVQHITQPAAQHKTPLICAANAANDAH